VEGTRPRGRPKKTWREIVEKDCRACGLNMEDAMDRSRWRKQIGMIDDHNECEWVPAHPGCPGQIPQSRKTVVCVCVLSAGVSLILEHGVVARVQWRVAVELRSVGGHFDAARRQVVGRG